MSDLLLRLYGLATTATVVEFQNRAMNLLAEALPFDHSWCGRSTRKGDHVVVHSSYMQNLPADAPTLLNLDDSGDTLASRTLARPGQAIVFTPKDVFQQPSTAALARYMQVTNAMCITSLDAATGLASFVAISRRDPAAEFSEPERQLLETLMPHLIAALDLCCNMQLARLRQEVTSDTTLMATADRLGFLHAMESGFQEALQHEWPDSTGTHLPSGLVFHMQKHEEPFLGQRVHVEFVRLGEQVVLKVRPRQRYDTLTPQERLVAKAFAAGQSYKEVARLLHLAPATVRHHLRSAYDKLGVSDKAALVQVLIGRKSPH